MQKLLLTLLFLSIKLFAEIDSDLDGVDDITDRCPNTPFEKTVDTYGCPEDEYYLGTLNFELLYNYIIKTKTHNKSFYIDYNYDNFLLNLSRAYSSDYTYDDSFLFGTILRNNTLLFRIYLGIEDQTPLIKNNYEFFYNSYTSFFEINYYDKQNTYISYILGISKNFNKTSLSIYYMNSGASDKFYSKYQDIQTTYTYILNQKFYAKIGAEYSITGNSLYDLYLSIGVHFE